MDQERFFVYILPSQSRVLYTGVTRDLRRWIYQHRQGDIPGFTRKYGVNQKKLSLIESVNAGWLDLAVDWFPKTES